MEEYGMRPEDTPTHGGLVRHEHGYGRMDWRHNYEKDRSAAGAPTGTLAQPRRSFRGKGPKGWSRPDARILEDVQDRLCVDDEVDASGVTVRVEGGVVTLEGEVRDRFMKWKAEDLAEDVNGVQRVSNRLKTAETRGYVPVGGRSEWKAH